MSTAPPRYRQKVQRRQPKDTSSREPTPQRQHRRPKYKQQSDPFLKDQNLIYHYTKLPDVPQQKKPKPNQDHFNNKLKQLTQKISTLKAQRTQQKTQYKKQTQKQNDRISEIKKNLKLGELCVRELRKDVEQFEDDLEYTEEQVKRLEGKLQRLEKRTGKQERKPIEKWTTYDFEEQIKVLERRLSKEVMDKRRYEEIAGQINRLQRQKVTAPQGQQPKNDDAAYIQRERQTLQKQKQIKTQLTLKKLDTQFKISSIISQLQRMQTQKAQLQNQLQSLKQGPQFKKSKQCKAKILQLRGDRQKLQQKHQTAVKDYEHEQKLLDYVRWASEVIKRRKEDYEYEKERRRKEKMRDQQFRERKEGGTGGKDAGKEAKEGGKEGEREERVRPPPPHPFAQEIDNLRFLISYCERLKPTAEEKEAEEKRKEEIDLQSAIKSGDWANMKGITVVASKKKGIDEVDIPKKQKKPKAKATKQLLPSSQLEHTIDVVRFFDNFKIVPPQKLEQVDNVIKQLNEKIEYYKTANPDIKRNQQQNTGASKPYRRKDEEVKTSKKAAINMVDFPSL